MTAPTKNNTLLPLHSNQRETQENIAPLPNRFCTSSIGLYQNYGCSVGIGIQNRCVFHESIVTVNFNYGNINSDREIPQAAVRNMRKIFLIALLSAAHVCENLIRRHNFLKRVCIRLGRCLTVSCLLVQNRLLIGTQSGDIYAGTSTLLRTEKNSNEIMRSFRPFPFASFTIIYIHFMLLFS